MAHNDMAWTKLDPAYVPRDIDTTKPSVARVYDAILGGKDNFAVDRAVAAEAVKAMGDSGNGARLNRAALGRAVRFMAGQGVAQFLDLGSGLPTAQNTHQIAQAVNPAVRVVYVDNDPSAYLHGQALLTGDAATTVVLADIREPDTLLAAPGVAGFLDFTQPVGLILNAVIHHLLDEEDPYGAVARYKEALAPGSYMQLTHFCDSSPEARANAQVLRESLGRGQLRGRDEIARFFDGLGLLEPGLVYLPEWRPDEPVRRPLDPGSMLMLVGVGRKP
ncbi:MAG TPA: SAM-dependent methyltransferase [Trebonia sp.]|nr:SAM-dependent methyltransferase [Trebonia sp.]